MKKNLFFVAVLSVVLIYPVLSFSQTKTSLHIGTTIPTSDFADDNINHESAGLAGVGFDLGLQLLFPLNKSGLNLYCETDVLMNGFSKNAKDDLENDAGNNVDVTCPIYFNIPIVAGVNYSAKANEVLSFFGNCGLGIDFLKATNMKWEGNNNKTIYETDLLKGFAVKFGGGCMFKDKYSINLNYCIFGKQEVKGKFKINGNIQKADPWKMNVAALTLTLGIRL